MLCDVPNCFTVAGGVTVFTATTSATNRGDMEVAIFSAIRVEIERLIDEGAYDSLDDRIVSMKSIEEPKIDDDDEPNGGGKSGGNGDGDDLPVWAWVLIGAGGCGVLLGGLYLVRRRRRRQPDYEPHVDGDNSHLLAEDAGDDHLGGEDSSFHQEADFSDLDGNDGIVKDGEQFEPSQEVAENGEGEAQTLEQLDPVVGSHEEPPYESSEAAVVDNNFGHSDSTEAVVSGDADVGAPEETRPSGSARAFTPSVGPMAKERLNLPDIL